MRHPRRPGKPPLTMWIGNTLMLPTSWRPIISQGKRAWCLGIPWEGFHHEVMMNFLLAYHYHLPRELCWENAHLWMIFDPHDYWNPHTEWYIAVSVEQWGHPRYIVGLEPYLTELEARADELKDLPDAAE